MIRCIQIMIPVIISMSGPASGSIGISDGVYNGLTFGLDSTLEAVECESLVNSIKDMLDSASDVLDDAAEGLSFGSVIAVVPDDWSSCGSYSVNNAGGYTNFESSDIKVGALDPIFGSEPWTLQPRGCGLEGEFIYLAAQWLLNSEISNEERGSRFVHEWAKYRWGVFEEYGHYGDPIYPESFREPDGSWDPNYCTDNTLQGGFTSSCTTSSDCEFVVEESPDVTSSLLAVPELSSVNKFCDSSTHKKEIPSKHNVICDKASVDEVIHRHPDLNTTRSSSKKSSKAVEITVLRESFLYNIVINFEITEIMDEVTNRFSFEKESIAQFIMYEAPSAANVGLISLTETPVKLTSQLYRIDDADTRQTLASQVISTDYDSDGYVPNLYLAITYSVELLSDENGIILLMTKATDEETDYSAEELASAAEGNPVWVVLYEVDSSGNLDMFTDLVYLTGGKLIVVQEEIIEDPDSGDVYVSPDVRMKLSQAFRQLLHSISSIDIQQILYEKCEKDEDPCTREIEIPSGYEYPTYLYIYHDVGELFDESDSDISVSGGECTWDEDDQFQGVRTTCVLRCTFDKEGSTLSITIARKRKNAIMIIEVVGRPIVNDSGFTLQVFGSTNLHELAYTSEMAPSIFAQILSNNTGVVYASITAQVTFNTTKASYSPFILRDDGTGADVTGNDGIYSAYLVPAIPVGDFSISFNTNNDNGEAKILPTEYDLERPYRCCGSVIPLPDSLASASSFSLSVSSISGTIKEAPSDLNLPPGSVKDLHVTGQDSNSVTLSFTASGEDLDYGTVDYYLVRVYSSNVINYTESKTTFTPKPAGQIETFTIYNIPCEKSKIVSIVAVDGSNLKSQESNLLVIYLYCEDISKETLSAGAIAGIVLLCLLFLIIIILLICYFCCRDKFIDDGKGKPMKVKGCSCCKKKDRSDYSTRKEISSPDVAAQSPPVERIRNIHDLMANTATESNQKEPNSNSSSDDRLPTIVLEPVDRVKYDDSGKEGFLTDSFTFTNVQKFGSAKSMQSARTGSPFVSIHSLNNVGIPMNNTPSSSYSDYSTIPVGEEGSMESFTQEFPPIPPKKVLYNTQV